MQLGIFTVFFAGVLTLATPCILPMLPVYFALLLGEGVGSGRGPGARPNRFRLVVSGAAFVAGFSLVFTLLGMAASSIGATLQEHRSTLLIVGGAVIVLFGLKLLGVVRIPWLDRTVQIRSIKTGSRLLNAFIFGVVFALGWTPCVGPVLAGVLSYAAVASDSAATGAAYLFAYSLGVGLPLLSVAIAADRLLPRLRRLHRHLPKLERATGALMVLLGLGVALPGALYVAHSASNDPDAARALAPSLGQQTEKPRLVEFYAEHCPVCERMQPSIDQLRTDCMGRRIEIIQVDVSDPANHSLAQTYGIHAVPAVVLLDKQGQKSAQLFGERPLSELRSAAAGLLASSCAGQAGRNTFSNDPAVPSCATGAPVEEDSEGALECVQPLAEQRVN